MKTTSERRIEIILDAISQLKAQTYRTGSFNYLKLPNNLNKQSDEHPNDQAQPLLCNEISSEQYCGVCAKGSLFLSTIRKENDLTLESLRCASNGLIMARLTKDNLFNRLNINLVEAYYEGWELYKYNNGSNGWSVSSFAHSGCALGGFGITTEQAEKFVADNNTKIAEYTSKYPSIARKERLIAILTNMVENDGVFEPLK